MDEIKDKKKTIREEIINMLKNLPENERENKTIAIEKRLFDFANYLESKIPLLYFGTVNGEVDTKRIFQKSLGIGKIVLLPMKAGKKDDIRIFKVDDLDTALESGPDGTVVPNRRKCKQVPFETVDIAIIPGIAFDEKGGRLGKGDGFYDKLIPRLPITTRKVALAFEDQILPQIPMQSHDKYVDIIITEKRIVYKI